MDGKERGRRMSITQEEFNDLLKLHLSINPLRETYAKLYAYKLKVMNFYEDEIQADRLSNDERQLFYYLEIFAQHFQSILEILEKYTKANFKIHIEEEITEQPQIKSKEMESLEIEEKEIEEKLESLEEQVIPVQVETSSDEIEQIEEPKIEEVKLEVKEDNTEEFNEIKDYVLNIITDAIPNFNNDFEKFLNYITSQRQSFIKSFPKHEKNLNELFDRMIQKIEERINKDV